MTDSLKIFLAQRNPTVGDIRGNIEIIRESRAAAAEAGADLAIFTELIVCGYPPEDLVLKPFFQDRVEAAVYELAKDTADGGPAILVSAPWRQEEGLYSAALLLDNGEVAAVRTKHELPNYSVFDEKRVFKAGPLPGPMPFRGVRLGVMTCEDMWQPDVTECLEESGAEVLIVINGSPYESNKFDLRVQIGTQRVTESGLPLVYVNQVGGQDELVFDGASFVLNADRSVAAWLPAFCEGGQTTDWSREATGWVCAQGERILPPEGLEATYRAMALGLADYVRKNGFPGVIVGLSGGIDSALTAAVAADALGPDKVHCVMMPSPYTSKESLEDAAACAKELGVELDEIGIEPAMRAFDEMLRPVFGDRAQDTTEENVQARSRGIVLMALSNKLGHMLLTTGNKSEMSVGYATLYGDMAGGYSVLKDVYKTEVFALAKWRNGNRPGDFLGPDGRVIPERIITKPPSAELRPDQKDEDSLPPYEVLDDILQCLIEGEMGLDEITARGHKPELVQKVWRMLDIAEYKRRQAPPGVKVTSRAFGRDRRYPITNSFTKIL
jgi:NAD+ synthase